MDNIFLRCSPSVFVINNEYEILICTKRNGIHSIRIGEYVFYEGNSGVLSSEKRYSRIRIPQKILDDSEYYDIEFQESISRKKAYSKLLPKETKRFFFKPLKKRRDIHIYHIADIHYRFTLATKTVAYFGEDTDLLIVNGDMGEFETEENYIEAISFLGDISQGRIPTIFVRGNHDTRGKLAERYTEYFPSNGKSTYYTFQLGCLSGIVLDCGEDKRDSNEEYGGVNNFASYRQQELSFLRSLTYNQEGIINFAISHICPVMTTFQKDSIFDIERECYSAWNEELERLGISFMLCGHEHTVNILTSDDKRNILPHKYPVIIGSACFGDDDFWGTALIVNKGKIEVHFTDKDNTVRECFEIRF